MRTIPAITRRAFAAVTLLTCFTVQAENISVSVADLTRMLSASDTGNHPALRRVQDLIDEAELQFDNGELVLDHSIWDQTVEEGCTRTQILTMNTKAVLNGNTGLALTMDSLYEQTVNLCCSDSRPAVISRHH